MPDRTITFSNVGPEKEKATEILWVYSQSGMSDAFKKAFPAYARFPLEFSCGEVTDYWTGRRIYGKFEIFEVPADTRSQEAEAEGGYPRPECCDEGHF